MRKFFYKIKRGLVDCKKVALAMVGVGIASIPNPAYAVLSSADIVTADAVTNIELVGLAIIGVALVKYGIKAAKSMIS